MGRGPKNCERQEGPGRVGLFQIVGVATAKQRKPKHVWHKGQTTNLLFYLDLRLIQAQVNKFSIAVSSAPVSVSVFVTYKTRQNRKRSKILNPRQERCFRLRLQRVPFAKGEEF